MLVRRGSKAALRTQRLTVVPVALVAVVTTAFAAGARPMEFSRSAATDIEHECLEAVPESVSVDGVNDEGELIRIETLVLVDDVKMKVAKRLMRVAQASYAPLALKLVPTYRSVTFPADGSLPDTTGGSIETADMEKHITRAKESLGGAAPEGIDVVLTITSKDLYLQDGATREYGIVGYADCIGGTRWDEHSFAIAESTGIDWGGVSSDDLEGATIAHEIGHLLGAHHHYSNCAQGEPPGNPCTLMFNFIDLVTNQFGAAEAPVVRGHARDFTSP